MANCNSASAQPCTRRRSRFELKIEARHAIVRGSCGQAHARVRKVLVKLAHPVSDPTLYLGAIDCVAKAAPLRPCLVAGKCRFRPNGVVPRLRFDGRRDDQFIRAEIDKKIVACPIIE